MKRHLLGFLAVLALQTASGQEIYNRGRGALTARDTAAAEVAFREAVKVGQKPAEANFYLGAFAYARRNFPDAQRYLEASLKFNDENVDALKLLGESYLEMKDVQSSLTQFRKAAKLAPQLSRKSRVRRRSVVTASLRGESRSHAATQRFARHLGGACPEPGLTVDSPLRLE